MFCSYTFLPAVLLAISVASLPVKRDVDPSLIPQFGWQSGVNPTGTGNCDGAVDGPNGQPIQIPCDCPPDRDFFIQQLNANVAAGHAVNNPPVEVSFPTDDSVASQLARLNAAAVTLQNLNGTGVGCPVASTDFAAQQAAIEAGLPLPPSVVPISGPAPTSAAPPTTTPSSISSAPSSAPSSPSSTISSTPAPTTSAPASGGLTEDQVAAVAPPLGWESGINPTGTGNCDGAVDDATGHPIEIPCSCPPSQDVYIAQLTANANAGKAINNPTVQLSYPLDNSTASQLTRINAASITLQNLNGPGVGCPIVSTTFSAQANAIQAGLPIPPSILPASPTAPTAAPASSIAAPASSTAVDVAAPAKSSAPPAVPKSTASTASTASAPGAPSATSTSASDAAIEALVPDLGFTAGVNPKGNGNCDGAVKGSDGQPVQVPCSCPPDKETFTQSLLANVHAGHAVNNPSVGVSFPLDNTKSALATRLQAAIVTLQNLNGSGKGCPAASTTLSAQLAAALS